MIHKNREVCNKIKYFVKEKHDDADYGYTDADYNDSLSLSLSLYIYIKTISDNSFSLVKPLFLFYMVILIRSAFEDDDRHYPQAFLEIALSDEEKSKCFVNIINAFFFLKLL